MTQIWEDTETGLRAQCRPQRSETVENEWGGTLEIIDPATSSTRPDVLLFSHAIPVESGTEWRVLAAGFDVWCAQVAEVQQTNQEYSYHTSHAAVYETDEVRLGLEIHPFSLGGFRWRLYFWWPGDTQPRPPESGTFKNYATCVAAGRAAFLAALTARGVDQEVAQAASLVGGA